MNPLSTWRCDTCSGEITDAGEAIVAWVWGEDLSKSDFRIIHKGSVCDFDRSMHTAELKDLLGIDGQSQLLSWLSYGPIKNASARERLVNQDQFVDLFRRLHIPWYEEARPFLRSEEVRDEWGDANEIGPYTGAVLRRIAQEGHARDKE